MALQGRDIQTTITVKSLSARFPPLCAACGGPSQTFHTIQFRRGNTWTAAAVATSSYALLALYIYLTSGSLADFLDDMVQYILPATVLITLLTWIFSRIAHGLREMRQKHDGRARQVVGLILFGLVALILGLGTLGNFAILPWRGWLIYLYLATCVVGYSLYNRALVGLKIPLCQSCARTNARVTAIVVTRLSKRSGTVTLRFRNGQYADEFRSANKDAFVN